MKSNYEKLSDLLAELFQFDQADLDFGIYRIMNAKRDEIKRFLDNDLLPQVQQAFDEYRSADRAQIEKQLEETIEQAKKLGADPETLPKVKEFREKLASSVDVTALENEVFSHLYDFFRRYYHEGDFLSLRRYKEGVYAIPYEGEEVKLYWANHDQYYVKSSEYLRDYAFKLPSGKRVHFKLVEADTEKDDIKPSAGGERRFVLADETPMAEENGELVIRFRYVPTAEEGTQKAKQKDLNAQAVEAILRAPGFGDWQAELSWRMPTEANPNRTLLEKHLTEYTARNTFDYFIHKDLGGFLRRELDFYIKNEVMHLDDVESESAPRVEQYLSKIKVIRKIAHRIIEFLAQIENFQKKLWLKKKFVVETNYCITVGNIPEEFYEHIASNEPQWAEWKELLHIDEEEENLFTAAARDKRGKRVVFLKSHPTLVLDTKHFNVDLRDRMLAGFDNLDEMTDGLLLHGENFQVLNLLLRKYRQNVGCIYIDPPYNTGGDEFLYKDGYCHSSWLSMMHDRLAVARHLLRRDGTLFVSIDDSELPRLRQQLGVLFGEGNFISSFVWNTEGHTDNQFKVKVSHEYILCYGYDGRSVSLGYVVDPNTREASKLWKGFAENSITKNGPGNPPSEVTLPIGFPCQADHLDLPPTDVPETFFREIERVGYVSREMTRRYKLTYPIRRDRMIVRDFALVEPCRVFSGWANVNKLRRFIETGLEPIAESDGKTSFHLSENGVVYYKKDRERARHILSVLRNMGTTEQMRYQLEHMGLHYIYPKPLQLLKHIARIGVEEGIVVDFFAGSGTTAHAIVDLNRQDGLRRKYILAEMGDFFDTVILPRAKNVTYTPEWKGGKPNRTVTREETERSPRIVKYQRIESYEDSLTNLEFETTQEQRSLLDGSDSFRESYMLSYILDVESKGSASLLSIDAFETPFDYKLNVATGSVGATKPVTADLVETFNYLLGLRVHHIDHIRGFRVVTGTSPKGEKVLVIWRNLKEKSNEDLDEFFRKQEYNPKDMEFDLIYVNGDNNLENLRREDETWKVRLIEEDFKRLMFDVRDV